MTRPRRAVRNSGSDKKHVFQGDRRRFERRTVGWRSQPMTDGLRKVCDGRNLQFDRDDARGLNRNRAGIRDRRILDAGDRRAVAATLAIRVMPGRRRLVSERARHRIGAVGRHRSFNGSCRFRFWRRRLVRVSRRRGLRAEIGASNGRTDGHRRRQNYCCDAPPELHKLKVALRSRRGQFDFRIESHQIQDSSLRLTES